MAKSPAKMRRIALFVEGDTERALPSFFHNWLDPKLPERSKVGIHAVKFQGVGNYLDDVANAVELYLTEQRVNFVVGLVDLYGLPPDRIDLNRYSTIDEKVSAARRHIKNLIPADCRDLFRQHFAVHETEAWLLAYPERWPPGIRDQIRKRPPEQVNFKEPPAKFLTRLLGRKYQKTVHAKNIFPFVDPQVAIDKCPFLKLLAEDLLEIAKRLQ